MPILDIEIVASPADERLPANLAQNLADAAARIFTSPPGRTWVKLHFLSAEQYAENNGKGRDIFPIFVAVIKSRVKVGDELKDEAKQLAQAVAQACQRPIENVHIIYQPEGSGRIAFGGNLIE